MASSDRTQSLCALVTNRKPFTVADIADSMLATGVILLIHLIHLFITQVAPYAALS
jgi:hypothetical protein